MEEEFLNISELRQFCFCPRIPYFHKYISSSKNIKPAWVSQGKDYHDKESKLVARRDLKKLNLEQAEKFFDYPLYDKELGLKGKADLLLVTSDKVYPVEFKMYGNSPYKGHKIQLCAYGMIASSLLKKELGQGFIIYSKITKIKDIEFTQELKEEVLKIRDKVISNYDKVLPDSNVQIEKCYQCEFIRHCNDRE